MGGRMGGLVWVLVWLALCGSGHAATKQGRAGTLQAAPTPVPRAAKQAARDPDNSTDTTMNDGSDDNDHVMADQGTDYDAEDQLELDHDRDEESAAAAAAAAAGTADAAPPHDELENIDADDAEKDQPVAAPVALAGQAETAVVSGEDVTVDLGGHNGGVAYEHVPRDEPQQQQQQQGEGGEEESVHDDAREQEEQFPLEDEDEGVRHLTDNDDDSHILDKLVEDQPEVVATELAQDGNTEGEGEADADMHEWEKQHPNAHDPHAVTSAASDADEERDAAEDQNPNQDTKHVPFLNLAARHHSQTSGLQSGMVRCFFTVDNAVMDVYYAGQKLTVNGNKNSWPSVKKVEFKEDGPAYLAISGYESAGGNCGCRCSGFTVYCRAQSSASAWDEFRTNAADWKVQASNANSAPTSNWYKGNGGSTPCVSTSGYSLRGVPGGFSHQTGDKIWASSGNKYAWMYGRPATITTSTKGNWIQGGCPLQRQPRFQINSGRPPKLNVPIPGAQPHKPVIIHGITSLSGGHDCVARAQYIRSQSKITFTLNEPNRLDGWHTTEFITGWTMGEAGAYCMDTATKVEDCSPSRLIQMGVAQVGGKNAYRDGVMDATANGGWTTVDFEYDFGDVQLIVIAQTMTKNEKGEKYSQDFSYPRIRQINQFGFQMLIEEDGGFEDHVPEEVAWLVVPEGKGTICTGAQQFKYEAKLVSTKWGHTPIKHSVSGWDPSWSKPTILASVQTYQPSYKHYKQYPVNLRQNSHRNAYSNGPASGEWSFQLRSAQRNHHHPSENVGIVIFG